MNEAVSQPGSRGGFENLVSLLSIVAVLVLSIFIMTLVNSSDLTPKLLPLPRTVFFQNDSPMNNAISTALSANDKHEVTIRFDQAVALLHAKQYEFAIQALDRVITLAPNMPEAYVNMGFALLGIEDYERAGNTFNYATELKVDQTNAYWGLALAMEGLKDYEGALGAMRSYIHLSKPDDPFLAKARSALWEWEEKLGRIDTDEVRKQQRQQQGQQQGQQQRNLQQPRQDGQQQQSNPHAR